MAEERKSVTVLTCDGCGSKQVEFDKEEPVDGVRGQIKITEGDAKVESLKFFACKVTCVAKGITNIRSGEKPAEAGV